MQPSEETRYQRSRSLKSPCIRRLSDPNLGGLDKAYDRGLGGEVLLGSSEKMSVILDDLARPRLRPSGLLLLPGEKGWDQEAVAWERRAWRWSWSRS